MEPTDIFLQKIVRSHLVESVRVKRRIIGVGGFDYSRMQTVSAGLSLPRYGAEDSGGESDATAIGAIVQAASTIAAAFKNGGKLLLCGNGGSAADCQHMAAEFTNILDRSFDRGPLPAIALTTDTSFLTSFVNDSRRFAEIFSRQVEALGRRGDVLIGISTSGGSENVIHAVRKAQEMGMATIALTGEGGPLAEAADIAIRVPSSKTSHIQEAHLAIEHVICNIVEEILFRSPPDASAPAAEGAV